MSYPSPERTRDCFPYDIVVFIARDVCLLPSVFCLLRPVLLRIRIIGLAWIDSFPVYIPRPGFDVADMF